MKNKKIEGTSKEKLLKFFKGKEPYRPLRNGIILVFIMFLCTTISMLFSPIRISESNIVMIYLLGILVFSILAEGYFYSLFASVCVVLLYNFFFTEPYYTLKVDNSDYIITFFVMFFVGVTASMLTIRFKMERQMVEEREKYIYELYNIERRLLNVKGWQELAQVSAEEISKQLDADALISFYNASGYLIGKAIEGTNVFSNDLDEAACLESYQSGNSCGRGTILFSGAAGYYFPILSQNAVLGVIGVSLKEDAEFTSAQRSFVEVISPQIAVVLEREQFYKKKQEAKMETHKERMRSDMLRTISHDFRTPLASIMGLASTELENYDSMDDATKKDFLQSIYEDADWLHQLVENILQTTRFDDNRIKLNMEQEAAEEIITEAVTHVKKHAPNHKIVVHIPDEVILIKADGVLLRQVIVNILNNAVNYSKEDSTITVHLYREENHAVFEIKDNGSGISDEALTHVFERYYKEKNASGRSRKGMGLGLALCKSIIEAHGGKIMIQKNKPKGTIVSFYIISEKEKSNGTTYTNC